jgi:uncharacterized protein YqeY
MIESIKKQLLNARKSQNKEVLSILTVVLGEVDTLKFSKGHSVVTNEEVIKIIKKLIEDNELLIQHGKNELIDENKILADLLPKFATQEEILTILQDIKDKIIVAKDGQAIGLAVKYIKSKNIPADNKDIITVVKSMKNFPVQ